jgi:putative ABC transport system ATP-binding protein
MSINLKLVSKIYETGEVKTNALKNVSFDVENGEFIVLLGPSGSGKSTLLNVCSGLDASTSGDIIVDDVYLNKMSNKELTKFRRDNLGFIFQQYNLLEALNVKENIELGKEIAKNPLDINQVIEQVGLTQLINKYPSELSGGEQQRVAIARAIVKNPKIMFCDEPTGALDEDNAKEVLGFIQKLNVEYNTTVILITHNQNISLLADKIVRLNSGEVVEIIINKNKLQANKIVWS